MNRVYRGRDHKSGRSFTDINRSLASTLLEQRPFHTGEWHSVDTSASPVHATYELEDVTLTYGIPTTVKELTDDLKPSVPWAEDHFQERVSGDPLNPPPSAAYWPYGDTTRHTTEKLFSHTYPERYWPKFAGERLIGGYYAGERNSVHNRGIRYAYGDLADVLDLLTKKPLTRQAYLPVWFPEDTGAVHGERVPCSLGYHFMIRGGLLSTRYYIRSCDFVRHFRDDVYMTARLTQWICDRLNENWEANESDSAAWVFPGILTMHISSLHAFVGDRSKLEVMAS